MMGYILTQLTDTNSNRNHLSRFDENQQNEAKGWLQQHSPSALYYQSKVILRKPAFPYSLFCKEQVEIDYVPVMPSTFNAKDEIYNGKPTLTTENPLLCKDAVKSSKTEERKSI
jgi:hypothetical protein